MAKHNIYDKIISELILRLTTASNNSGPTLKLTSTLGSTSVPVGYSGNITFTSEVLNIPLGYSIDTNTHTIAYPGATPPTTGSSALLTGPSIPVALALLASTFVVTSTVVLISGSGPNIVLTDSITITAVAPGYFGVLPYNPVLTTTGLTSFAPSVPQFQLTSTGIGRLIIALPIGSGSILSISQDNGLIYPVSDFSVATYLGFVYYTLTYDTQFTGVNVKTFTINYV